MVQKVADRLIRANGLGSGATAQNPSQIAPQAGSDQPVQWKVRVIDDKSTKNAFVLPNGAIFVFVSVPLDGNESVY